MQYRCQSISTSRKFLFGWLVALLAAGYAVYWNGIGGRYYNDNFQLAFDIRHADPFRLFYAPHPYHGFYRPIESAILIAVQSVAGLDTTPVILFLIAIHALVAWIVWIVVRSMKFTRLQASLASSLMLLAQSNTYDIDTVACISNVLSVFFGLLALIAMLKAGPDFSRWYLFGLVFLILSLLSKEAGVAFVGMSLVMVTWSVTRRQPAQYWKLILNTLPILLVTLAYILIRTKIAVPIRFGGTDYDFNVGLNIPKHVIMYIASAFISVPSPDVFVAVRQGDYLLPAIGVLCVLFLFAIAIHGVWRNRKNPLIRGIALFAVAAAFPMAVMNHISEHQTYSMLPFLAILFGIGAGDLLERTRGMARYGIIGMLVGVLGLNVYAIQRKSTLLKASGEQAHALLLQVVPLTRNLAPNSTLILVNPPEIQPSYSGYFMNTFNSLRYGVNRINEEAGRDDVRVVISDQKELGALQKSYPNATVLTFKDGRISIMAEK